MRPVKGLSNVRFGSKADICAAISHVRFTPNSDSESRHPQPVMSALPPNVLQNLVAFSDGVGSAFWTCLCVARSLYGEALCAVLHHQARRRRCAGFRRHQSDEVLSELRLALHRAAAQIAAARWNSHQTL